MISRDLIIVNNYEKACSKAGQRHSKRGVQRVVKEGFHYLVMDSSKFDRNYRYMCNSKKWHMDLVFTSEPFKKITLKERFKLWRKSKKDLKQL